MKRRPTAPSVLAYDMDGTLYAYNDRYVQALREAQGVEIHRITEGRLTPEEGR